VSVTVAVTAPAEPALAEIVQSRKHRRSDGFLVLALWFIVLNKAGAATSARLHRSALDYRATAAALASAIRATARTNLNN